MSKADEGKHCNEKFSFLKYTMKNFDFTVNLIKLNVNALNENSFGTQIQFNNTYSIKYICV